MEVQEILGGKKKVVDFLKEKGDTTKKKTFFRKGFSGKHFSKGKISLLKRVYVLNALIRKVD